ncbi:AraC family transcriptional regulator [Mycobacterium sp. 3519A]|uniref:AraC family transcriptional regulator n=1 Tax=Mycobacterium sp. 3519A TaxID=2057184 RepID=UPI000C79D438|nr:AraC family transcriptional regulator [Mycobacterium sp. 3519A]
MSGVLAVDPAGELFAQLSAAAGGHWPGVSITRCTSLLQCDGVRSLSLVFVAQRTDAPVVGSVNYLVAAPGHHLDCEIPQGFSERPVLGLVVAIDPQLVRSVVTSVRGVGIVSRDPSLARRGASVADAEMVSTVSRFLGSLSVECDRRVLAPLLLRELVYRVLRGEQGGRLMRMAAEQEMTHPVGAAVAYIDTHLADALTVDALAARVCLSPSSFSRAFREMTGFGPYQYVKEARLVRAQQLLDGGRCSVADAARQVGYVSVSNFIKAFRRRFGVTPGDYANAHPFRQAC